MNRRKQRYTRAHTGLPNSGRDNIILEFINTDKQLADIFTKSLSEKQFCFIRQELGMSNPF